MKGKTLITEIFGLLHNGSRFDLFRAHAMGPRALDLHLLSKALPYHDDRFLGKDVADSLQLLGSWARGWPMDGINVGI